VASKASAGEIRQKAVSDGESGSSRKHKDISYPARVSRVKDSVPSVSVSRMAH